MSDSFDDTDWMTSEPLRMSAPAVRARATVNSRMAYRSEEVSSGDMVGSELEQV